MNFKKQNNIIFGGGLLAIIVGILVILGWLFNITFLKSVFPGYVAMKFNTALGFVLCGANILLLIFRKKKTTVSVAAIFSGVIFLIGFTAILQTRFNVNLEIDELFFKDVLSRNTRNPFPGRMANTTAFCFSLLGFAFMGVASNKHSIQLLSQYLLHVVSAISFIEMMGYLYSVQVFFERSNQRAMAIHTSAVLILISIAVSNFNPSHGFTSLFSGSKTGNVMARRLFPLTLFSLLLLGFIRLEVKRYSLVPDEFAFVLFAISSALVGLFLIWNTAIILNRIDEKRTEAEEALKLANQNLEGTVKDRTYALQQSLKLLEESSKQNKIFVMQSPSAVAMVDCDMRYIAVSERWIKDYNLVGRNIVGRSHYEICCHDDDRKGLHQQCLKEGIVKKGESKFKQQDESEQWIKWEIKPWFISKQNIGGLLMYTEDVTDRKQIDEKNKQNERIFSSLFYKSPSIISIVDASTGKFVNVNEASSNFWGYKKEEILGKTSLELNMITDHGKRSEVLNSIWQNGSVRNEEMQVRSAIGERWLSISADLIDLDGKNCYLSVATDITDKKASEEKSRRYLAIESKSKEMEQFVYVASHDLREPVLTMKNYVEIFIEDFSEQINEDGMQYLTSISGAAKRMDELIKGLLDYSRLSKVKPIEEVDCNAIVKQVTADIALLINKTRAIIHVGHLPSLKAFPLELKLLFQNLLDNAIKFRRKDVSPVIDITAIKINDGWQFECKDNGIGIAEKDRERIFILFQRLHERSEYEGTGIGLAHCKKIVELHQGNIWIESVPRQGSTFYFTIIT